MNATNVFLDILKSAITQTECDNLDGLDTDVWIRVYDISQKQQLSPLIYQQIFSAQTESSNRFLFRDLRCKKTVKTRTVLK